MPVLNGNCSPRAARSGSAVSCLEVCPKVSLTSRTSILLSTSNAELFASVPKSSLLDSRSASIRSSFPVPVHFSLSGEHRGFTVRFFERLISKFSSTASSKVFSKDSILGCLKVWPSDSSPTFSAIHSSLLRAELLRSLLSTVPLASLQSSIQCLLSAVSGPFDKRLPICLSELLASSICRLSVSAISLFSRGS